MESCKCGALSAAALASLCGVSIRDLSPLGRDTDRDEVNYNSRAGVQGGKLPSSLAPGNEANLSELVVVNPLDHSGWDECIANERGGSLFHTTIWARVLQETYGHKPVYVCQALGGKFQRLLPIMEVSSPWTGRRGVSLPFTDICIPLSVSEHPREMYEFAMEQGRRRAWRYLECRGGNWECPGVSPSLQFWGHVVDLENSEESLFKRLNGAARRGIRKAQRNDLQIEFSTELSAMKDFFRLHCVTRRRHGIPPQPWLFFERIAASVIGSGHGFVVTARSGNKPVAGAVFFQFGEDAVYKFGASDYESQRLRANNLVLWTAVRRYAANGFKRLHLGRTSLSNEGLRRFKLGFGASEEKIQYFKYDFRKESFIAGVDRTKGWLTTVFRRLPRPILRIIGGLAYPHLS
jgi:hypothetical protein